MTTILGIDEAGRGPVLGPLIISGVMINEIDEQKLIEIEVKDSKLIEHSKREILFDKIINIAKTTRIITIGPKEVDDAVLSQNNMNLNWLEAHKSAEIINKLNPEKSILDCPSPNTSRYKEYVGKLVENKDIEIISENKADFNFVIVSAASILAKAQREREMAKIKKKYGDTGAGYTSDPKTQEFLKNNWNKCPEIFRRSWASWKKYSDEANNKKLTDF